MGLLILLYALNVQGELPRGALAAGWIRLFLLLAVAVFRAVAITRTETREFCGFREKTRNYTLENKTPYSAYYRAVMRRQKVSEKATIG